MQWKDDVDKRQFYKTDSMLQTIVCKLDEISKAIFNKEIFITSLFRKKADDTGLHEVGRASDLRTENYYTRLQITIFVFIINNIFVYDDKRRNMNVAVYHQVPGSTWHLHIQVHPNTKQLW